MKARGFVVASMLIVTAFLAVPNAMSQVSVGIGVRFGPPPPRHEVVVVAPFPNAVWIGGHWAWDDYDGRYIWISGRWVHERPMYSWVDGGWHRGPRGWAWREGYWHHRDRGGEGWHGRHEDQHGRHHGKGRH